MNIKTIFYYERIKMLPLPARTTGLRPAKMDISFHSAFLHLGFTFEEIRDLLALGKPERALCADGIRSRAHIWRAFVVNPSDLVKIDTKLAEAVSQCADGVTPDCPVLNDAHDGYSRRR